MSRGARRRPKSLRVPVGDAQKGGVFQFRNLPPLVCSAFRPGHRAARNAYFLARVHVVFVAPHEVFPLVEIRRDGDIEKTPILGGFSNFSDEITDTEPCIQLNLFDF